MTTSLLISKAAQVLLAEAPQGRGARYTNQQALDALRWVDADWHRPLDFDEAVDVLTAVMDEAHSIWEEGR